MASNYDFSTELLGHGHSSRVIAATHRPTSTPVAIKIFTPPARLTREVTAAWSAEASVLTSLQDVPDVVRLFEVFHARIPSSRSTSASTSSMQSSSPSASSSSPSSAPTGRGGSGKQNGAPRQLTTNVTVCFVFERIDGMNLLELVYGPKAIRIEPHKKEDVIRPLFRQVVSIVAQIHARNIAHLDLKPENIMHDSHSDRLVLIDFGFSERIDPSCPVSVGRRSGSIEYAAPEIVYTDCKYDGTKADIWSMGVILYVLLCEKFPFAPDNAEDEGGYVCHMPDYLSRDAVGLLEMILRMDAYERPSADEILRHPWFKGSE